MKNWGAARFGLLDQEQRLATLVREPDRLVHQRAADALASGTKRPDARIASTMSPVVVSPNASSTMRRMSA